MPIHIDQMDTQVEVQDPQAPPQAPPTPPAAAALQRWDELDRRAAEQRERTAAWGFDD